MESTRDLLRHENSSSDTPQEDPEEDQPSPRNSESEAKLPIDVLALGAFELNLMLPEANPLIRRTLIPREHIHTIFDFDLRGLVKFVGTEISNRVFLEDIMQPTRTSARVYREIMAERKMAKAINERGADRNTYDRLLNYFNDETKVIYKRTSDINNPESFNSSKFNLKKYLAQGAVENKKNTTLPREKENEDLPLLADEFKDCYYQPKSRTDQTLVFESRFESGNLAMAAKVADDEYNLILQNDVNTYGYGQWYFFEVRNTRRGQNIKFNIMNLRKTDSLYNQGMKILIYSMKGFESGAIGWFRGGTNILYSCNNCLRENLVDRFYRTLSFEYQFEHDYDRVFFAYSHPYTYTDLCDFLDTVERDESKSQNVLRSTLCRTLAGNKVEMLTITNKDNPHEAKRKKCIVLTGRVHPGETNSSFMIQGAMEFLVSNEAEAQRLRSKFIFKVIPMLNPDGVIHGNYRTDLTGCDLNRRWGRPSEILHPTIFHARKLIWELDKRYKVAFFCDFHGHSKKQISRVIQKLRKNIFIYGCLNEKRPFQCREFPWILSKICPEFFNFFGCSYRMSRYKAGAARIALHEQLNLTHSFTLEASFFGSDRTKKHFTSNDLIEFGHKFCQGLGIFYPDPKPTLPGQTKTKSEQEEVAAIRQSFLQDLYANKDNIADDEEDSGSESNLSEDEMPDEIILKLLPKVDKKKYFTRKVLRTRNLSQPFTDPKLNKPKTEMSISKVIPEENARSISPFKLSENYVRTADPLSENEGKSKLIRNRRLPKFEPLRNLSTGRPNGQMPPITSFGGIGTLANTNSSGSISLSNSQSQLKDSNLITKHRANIEKSNDPPEMSTFQLRLSEKTGRRGVPGFIVEKLNKNQRKRDQIQATLSNRDLFNEMPVIDENSDKVYKVAEPRPLKPTLPPKRKMVSLQPTVITIIDQNKKNEQQQQQQQQLQQQSQLLPALQKNEYLTGKKLIDALDKMINQKYEQQLKEVALNGGILNHQPSHSKVESVSETVTPRIYDPKPPNSVQTKTVLLQGSFSASSSTADLQRELSKSTNSKLQQFHQKADEDRKLIQNLLMRKEWESFGISATRFVEKPGNKLDNMNLLVKGPSNMPGIFTNRFAS